MPVYTYAVKDGDEYRDHIEVMQRMSDPPLTEHPQTGEPVVRIISLSGAPVFRGRGFHATDYPR